MLLPECVSDRPLLPRSDPWDGEHPDRRVTARVLRSAGSEKPPLLARDANPLCAALSSDESACPQYLLFRLVSRNQHISSLGQSRHREGSSLAVDLESLFLVRGDVCQALTPFFDRQFACAFRRISMSRVNEGRTRRNHLDGGFGWPTGRVTSTSRHYRGYEDRTAEQASTHLGSPGSCQCHS